MLTLPPFGVRYSVTFSVGLGKAKPVDETSLKGQIPRLWRLASPFGPNLFEEYESEFLGCRIERLFYFVWRHVCLREERQLRKRVKDWYSEDLAAKPGSHKPLEQRVGKYPPMLREEERSYLRDLNAAQRLTFNLLVWTMPAAGDYLAELRYRYRFFGVGDEVWIGDQRRGRGKELE